MIHKCNDEAEFIQLFIKYADLCIRPFDWTVLHYIAIFKPAYLASLPTYSQAKVFLLTDKAMKTPLHYFLAQNPSKSDLVLQNKIFAYMLDYLEHNMSTSPYNCKLAMDSLSPLLPLILHKLSPSLSVRFINLCDQETRAPYGVTLPEFGDHSELRFVISDGVIIQQNAQEKICKEGGESIDFQSLMLKLNYNYTSEDMRDIVQTLSETENEAIFNTAAISRLIVHLWKPTKKYYLVLGLLFSILMIAISIFFANKQNNGILVATIIALTSIFIVLELIQLRSNGLKHFESFWNYVDAFFLVAVPFKAVEGLLNVDANNDDLTDGLQSSWMCVGILFVGYVRWVSYLQIFEPTSMLSLFLSETKIHS